MDTQHGCLILCETTTYEVFSVPEYNAVPNKGGVTIVIKNYLHEYITAVDIIVNDQMLYALSFMPSIWRLYYPQSDSR